MSNSNPASALDAIDIPPLSADRFLDARTVDMDGNAVNLYQRYVNPEGEIGSFVALAGDCGISIAESGYADHAVDSFSLVYLPTCRLLPQISNAIDAVRVVNELRDRATAARAKIAKREAENPQPPAPLLNRDMEGGVRVYIPSERMFGDVLLLDREEKQAFLLIQDSDAHDYTGFWTCSFDDVVVQDDEPLSAASLADRLSKYLPASIGVTFEGRVPQTEEDFAELAADVSRNSGPGAAPVVITKDDPYFDDGGVMPAFGQDDLPKSAASRGRRVPDGAYVFNIHTKTLGYVLFGDDDRVVVRSTSTDGPEFLAVWEKDFTEVLNLTPVSMTEIDLELEDLLAHPDVGDAAIGGAGRPNSRIILALEFPGVAITFTSGNAAMKPRFEMKKFTAIYKPITPFRKYTQAEVRQIIRSHRQIEDAPLSGSERGAA